jgi:hypothetical protein
METATAALIVAGTAVGTGVALRALPAGMCPEIRLLARLCSAGLGVGVWAVLTLAALILAAGPGTVATLVLEAILAGSLAIWWLRALRRRAAALPTTKGHPRPETPATWATWREALAMVVHPRNLRRTVIVALVVGSVLFAINQLDVVVHGGVDAGVALRIGLTYLVPFCVSNYGILAASRFSEDDLAHQQRPTKPDPTVHQRRVCAHGVRRVPERGHEVHVEAASPVRRCGDREEVVLHVLGGVPGDPGDGSHPPGAPDGVSCSVQLIGLDLGRIHEHGKGPGEVRTCERPDAAADHGAVDAER